MQETTWADQRTPALAIVARGDQIQATGPLAWTVRSQSRPEAAYAVVLRDGKWTCTCAHHATTGTCIHVLAVKFQADLKAQAGAEVERVATCPSCRASDSIRYGVRRNKSGPVHLYLCRPCGHRFSGKEGFQRRRADPSKIALALDLYFRGLSLRKVADHFEQAHALKVSPMTIYRWVVHYSRLAAEWMDSQRVQTGQRWHMDETVVKVDGGHRYLWNVLDADSRFLLATYVSANRSLANTRAPIKKAKAVASQRPLEVFTDGMMAYPDAIQRELGSAQRGTTPHRRVPSIRAPESNNRIERLHGTEKERTKVMRGFDGERGTAALMEGFRAHYNLVRPHSGLAGLTPAEAAGLAPIPGFKWKALLEAATRLDTQTPKEA
jgi:transposase-like protein